MLRNIKDKIWIGLIGLLFLVHFGVLFGVAVAQDIKSPPCSILSSTITCGSLSLTLGGSVTSVSVTTANGVSGNVATSTTTPAITLTLGDIVPSTISTSIISTNNATYFHGSSATLTDYSAGNAGTLTNAPSIGNPTKWIAINDNGTIRKIPAW